MLCCYRRPANFINSSTIKAQCSPNHTMVYTENGTTPLFDDALPTRSYDPPKSGCSFCRTVCVCVYIYMGITNSLDNSWMKDCRINTVQGTTVLSSRIYPRFELFFSFHTKEQTYTHRFAYMLSGNIYCVDCIRQTSKYLL